MGKSIAVVGASTDRTKYGNKAVRAFRDGGWTVYPINPGEEEIEGVKCWHSILDVPDPIDRVAMYVPPSVGIGLLDDIARKAPKEFFLNPGSSDDALLEKAQELGLDPIQACSIVSIGLRPDMYADV